MNVTSKKLVRLQQLDLPVGKRVGPHSFNQGSRKYVSGNQANDLLHVLFMKFEYAKKVCAEMFAFAEKYLTVQEYLTVSYCFGSAPDRTLASS